MVTGYETQMYGDIHLIRVALERLVRLMEEEHVARKEERQANRERADREGANDTRQRP